MSIVDFNNNGYSNIKIPKSLLKTIRKAILQSVNHKFKKDNFHSYDSFFFFLKKISDKDFKDKFGLQVWRILDSHNTKKINNWVEKVIPKQLNCKKASLNIITKSEYNKNNYLKNEQYCAFYRVVRRDKKDVTKPKVSDTYIKRNRHRVVKPIKTDGTEVLMFHADTIHFANINTTTDFRIS